MSVIIGVGGNVGDESAIVERFSMVRDSLAALGSVRSAPLYRTAPIGPAQPPFLNTALSLRAADMQPRELLSTLQELEILLGRDRDREVRWGPRPIDLDILAWDDRVIDTPELRVPHPHLHERRFALAPLVDLFGEAHEVPRIGALGPALARVRDQACELIRETW